VNGKGEAPEELTEGEAASARDSTGADVSAGLALTERETEGEAAEGFNRDGRLGACAFRRRNSRL